MNIGKRPGFGVAGWAVLLFAVNALVALLIFMPRKQARPWSLSLPAMAGKAEAHPAHLGEAGPDAPGPMVAVENVNVMIERGGRDHFLEATFALEVATEGDRAGVEQRLSRIREASIGFLSGVTPDDLRGSAGLEKAKATLLESYRNAVPGQRLKAVYVTRLVMD